MGAAFRVILRTGRNPSGHPIRFELVHIGHCSAKLASYRFYVLSPHVIRYDNGISEVDAVDSIPKQV